MPRPRTPLSKAELTGAAAHDPQRFRNGARSEPELSGREIGDPPKHLMEDEHAVIAWNTFADELPWLTYEDRGVLEICAIMRGVLIRGDLMQPASFYSTYRGNLQSLGATPVDRSKVFQLPKDQEDDDPFEKFGKPN